MDDAITGCETVKLQEAIANAFPAYPYHGQVLEGSHDPSVYEDETDNLDMLLSGKSWKDLELAYVNHNEDEYVLMNDRALPAFLGAWLWRAAEDINSHNQIRSSLSFHLAESGGSEAAGTGLWGGGFRGLNQKQRDVVHQLLECAARSALPDKGERINRAIKSIEENRCPK